MNQGDAVMDILEVLGGAEAPLTRDCCIYKVPSNVRKLNEDAYTPEVVSIGPFHHNRHPRLHNMERQKQMYCKAFLERTQTNLNSWISYIEVVVPHFRRCYSDALEFSNEDLVRIVSIDSGFIFELFWKTYYHEWSDDDKYFLKPWLIRLIRLDLLLLENQLPFFVLDHLFNLSCPGFGNGSTKSPSFIELTFDYFAYFNISNLKFDDISISHFTDLLRTFHLQHPLEIRPRRIEEPAMEHFPSATELSEAGVRFKGNTNTGGFLDLKFSGRVLEIPLLKVDDSSELLFRNMLALEHCHYPFDCYVTDFFFVLGFIGKTSRDVDILVRQRVLVNYLGNSDSVATMFNDLCKNLMPPNCNSDYHCLRHDLNAFCRDPWHKLTATLRRWQGAASIAGIVLLILTLVQSVCSVWQVVPLRNNN